VIVTLGGPATKLMLRTDIGITRLRGQWARYENGDLAIDVMPTFHPAYLLRNYTRETRESVWSDIQAVMTRIAQPS
jgi:uracil-DNA glycosylase family 4